MSFIYVAISICFVIFSLCVIVAHYINLWELASGKNSELSWFRCLLASGCRTVAFVDGVATVVLLYATTEASKVIPDIIAWLVVFVMGIYFAYILDRLLNKFLTAIPDKSGESAL